MSVLRDLRKLVLGETWILPLGVLVLVGLALLLRDVAPDLWEDFGGFLLAGGVLALLGVAVARS
jgi:hypothetical protein